MTAKQRKIDRAKPAETSINSVLAHGFENTNKLAHNLLEAFFRLKGKGNRRVTQRVLRLGAKGGVQDILGLARLYYALLIVARGIFGTFLPLLRIRSFVVLW